MSAPREICQNGRKQLEGKMLMAQNKIWDVKNVGHFNLGPATKKIIKNLPEMQTDDKLGWIIGALSGNMKEDHDE